MTADLLLPPEHATIVSAAITAGEPRAVVVVPGDLDLICDNCGASASLPLGVTCPNHLAKPTPPARYAEHDKTCEFCGSGQPDAAWIQNCPACHGTGRNVVRLVVECPTCEGSCCDSPCLAAHPDDGRPHGPCPACGRSGTVPLALAIVGVVPIEQSMLYSGFDPSGATALILPALARAYIVDPVPVPGRDWGVVFEFVGGQP